MQIALTPGALASLSQSRERINRVIFWAVSAALALCAGSAFHHVLTVSQPWLKAGQLLSLAAVIYLASPALERGAPRRKVDEPSVRFLIREYQERNRICLWIRNRLLWCVPGVLASWWGVLEVRGFQPLARTNEFFSGSSLFFLTFLCLAALWFALGAVADRALLDAEDVGRNLDA
ncbi:MAG: hypothetical protein JNM66_27205 [Bryobacterales bacterium]|nr:hypothetical protein [Bryobacterales bacterium]